MGGYAIGYQDARTAAARLCEDFAEELDHRHEEARQAGVTPREPVRRLRQAARRIASLTVPAETPEAGRGD